VWKLIEDPTSEEALRYAVWYFRSHGSQADAELVLETARRNVGDKPWLLQYAGLIAAESGNWEAAKAAFTESFHVSPTWSSAYNASIAHFFTGWPQRGASLLEDALFLAEHSNDERRSVAYLARVRTTDDREVAMQSLREALEIDPGSPEALLLLRSLEPGRD
jgi:tetratricopeptide (TPR) repeat protein